MLWFWREELVSEKERDEGEGRGGRSLTSAFLTDRTMWRLGSLPSFLSLLFSASFSTSPDIPILLSAFSTSPFGLPLPPSTPFAPAPPPTPAPTRNRLHSAAICFLLSDGASVCRGSLSISRMRGSNRPLTNSALGGSFIQDVNTRVADELLRKRSFSSFTMRVSHVTKWWRRERREGGEDERSPTTAPMLSRRT